MEIISQSSKYIGTNLVNDFPRLYSWFFDAPYYSKNDFIEMIDLINSIYPNRWLENLCYPTFDHLIYQYFLISKKGFSIFDYSSLTNNLPEQLTADDLLSLCGLQNYWPTWLSSLPCARCGRSASLAMGPKGV